MSRKRKRVPEIHRSIKTSLGYDADTSDEDVFEDWQQRKTRVCKPCWELKYYPYGPLVEQSPLLPSLRDRAVERNEYLAESLRTGFMGRERRLTDADRTKYQRWLDDEQMLLKQARFKISNELRTEQLMKIENEEERLRAFAGGDLPPIHIYRVPFDNDPGAELREDDFLPEVWKRIQEAVDIQRARYADALAKGVVDDRNPLDPVRRSWFQRQVDEFDPEDHPEIIPREFTEAECNIFGHICPVFFAAEALTETEGSRRIGRRPIRFATMIRIVRRDDYRCRHCKKQLRDDEVEFDHIIPVSKGGSSEEHNLRLTCFECNRDKSDDHEP